MVAKSVLRKRNWKALRDSTASPVTTRDASQGYWKYFIFFWGSGSAVCGIPKSWRIRNLISTACCVCLIAYAEGSWKKYLNRWITCRQKKKHLMFCRTETPSEKNKWWPLSCLDFKSRKHFRIYFHPQKILYLISDLFFLYRLNFWRRIDCCRHQKISGLVQPLEPCSMWMLDTV